MGSADLRPLQVCGFQSFTAGKAADFEKHEVCATLLRFEFSTAASANSDVQMAIICGTMGRRTGFVKMQSPPSFSETAHNDRAMEFVDSTLLPWAKPIRHIASLWLHPMRLKPLRSPLLYAGKIVWSQV